LNASPLNPEEISHRITGDIHSKRIPLVFLHGLMGFSANWGKIWPQFDKERAVLVLDQRGHGKSAKPQNGYSPDDYAADLKQLLNHLGWNKVHLVGHSMGGRVAMHFSKHYPNMLATLTLEDSGAEARPDRLHWIKNLLGSTPTPFPDRETAKKFFADTYADDPMTGGFLFSNLYTREDGKLDWRFYAPGMIETIEKGRVHDAMDILAHTQVPILLVRGGNSAEFTADEAERMQRLHPNIFLSTIPDAGHLVHAQQPEKFGAALKEFMERFE
jgi:esterase